MKKTAVSFFALAIIFFTQLSVSYAQSTNPFSNEPEFLPVEQAFEPEVSQQQPLLVSFNIKPGYYLYKQQFKVEPAEALEQPINFPPSESHVDEFFGESQVFRDYLEFSIAIKPEYQDQSITLRYQGCADAGLCYPPTTIQLQDAKSTAATQEEADPGLFELDKQPLSWSLVVFFVLGIGLAFTPCVFPMYPILSSVVIGDRPRTFKNAFWLSFVYVQGMAITYSLLGLVVALAGMQYQAYFQHPAVLIVLSIAFAAFALSMLGVYSIQLPATWQTKLQTLSGRQKGGNTIGVFLIGVISGLVASPCTTAPLSGALLYIAQSGDVTSGAAILYALSLGMGVPLIIFGVSGGKLLPKAGAWMDIIKHGFGWLLLAVVVVLLERLLSTQQSFVLWLVYFVALAAFMGQHLLTLKKPVARVLLLIILVGGSSSGIYWQVNKLNNAQQVHSLFTQVNNLSDIEQQLQQARANDQWVMLDLYADWCVACKEFEQYTFADKQVREQLASFKLLQADVTANNSVDQEILSKFQVLGLPTVLFFSPNGEQQTNWRITGFKDAEAFLQHIEQMKATAGP
ncbi:MAG: protein-disulfide reductase DsbD [Pseudomonadota bacterium]